MEPLTKADVASAVGLVARVLRVKPGDRLRWAFASTDTVFYVTGADNSVSLHFTRHSASGK